MKNLKLVIFDLDGVLVDACEWHRAALNEALKEVCNYEISDKDHVLTFNGIPTRTKLDILSNMNIVPRDCHEEIYKLKQEKTIEAIREKSKNRPEKVKLINELKERSITVCCFTNSIRETADLMLETSGIKDLFDMIVTNQDVKNPKPDPEGYLKILSHFKIHPDEAVIIEDSPKGIEAAILSGCHVVGVKNADDVSLELFSEILE